MQLSCDAVKTDRLNSSHCFSVQWQERDKAMVGMKKVKEQDTIEITLRTGFSTTVD